MLSRTMPVNVSVSSRGPLNASNLYLNLACIDNERVYLVKEKLDQLQNSLSKQRITQLGKIYERITALESRMKSTFESRESVFNVMGSQVICICNSRLINLNR